MLKSHVLSSSSLFLSLGRDFKRELVVFFREYWKKMADNFTHSEDSKIVTLESLRMK